MAYLKDFFKFRFASDIKDYVILKEDIYIHDCVVGDDPFQIEGLQIPFPGITERKLAELLAPTEGIFNKRTEINQFSPEDIEVNKQVEIENFIKKFNLFKTVIFIR